MKDFKKALTDKANSSTPTEKDAWSGDDLVTGSSRGYAIHNPEYLMKLIKAEDSCTENEKKTSFQTDTITCT